MRNSRRSVEAACATVLARACNAGSRQQARAAARRFVRRHRRDTGYLAWVLRSAGVSSSLAAALLGLGASPASAAVFGFDGLGLSSLAGDFGSHTAASIGDLDGDGDPDLVVSRGGGDLLYFLNTGSATSPAFTTGPANPLAGQDAGANSIPALGDLDGDGDLDLVVGRYEGDFPYFENTGSVTSPAFVARTGALNPFAGQDVGEFSTPSLGDLDGDGDLDLVTGRDYGDFPYLENTGSAANPVFVARTGAQNPLHGQSVGTGANSVPALGDLDGDGDLDLVSGEYFDTFFYFENTGSATSPAFVSRTGAQSPLSFHNVGAFSAPSLGDLDGDGDPDMVAGDNYGLLTVFEHRRGQMMRRTHSANPLNNQDVGDSSAASLGDLDGDGDLDVVAGRGSGDFPYFENTGSAASPKFVARTGALNPLAGQDVGLASRPSLGDLDGDGDRDLVAGRSDGDFLYYENTGSAASAAFAARTGIANPLDGQDVGSDSAPALGDLDGDGDLDLLSGELAGVFFYYENTGSAVSPAFVARTGAQNPLVGQGVGVRSTPSLRDVEGDGDVDLLSGEQNGVFFYFANTGSAAAPTFVARTGRANPLDGHDLGSAVTPSLGDLDADGDLDLISGESGGTFSTFESFVAKIPFASELIGSANPLAEQDVGDNAAASLGDLDGDGDLDLVAGEQDGTFPFFENTGSAVSAAFVARTGAANPFDGLDGGVRSVPSLADLDADGDLDLVSGLLPGTFRYFENSGTAVSPAFVARTGAANPLADFDIDLRSAPSLGDLDGDRDPDLLAGQYGGFFYDLFNTGSATAPAFTADDPMLQQDVFDAAPALGDLDRDGDLDLVSGDTDGALHYFDNQGDAENPLFAELAGPTNPLAAEDVGALSKPALGDLDGDGNLDLVTGTQDGTFRLHSFPEPMRGLLLGAGLALLGALDRLRRRRVAQGRQAPDRFL